MSISKSTGNEETTATRSISYVRSRSGECALVLIHGFLDDRNVWEPLLEELKAPGFEIVQVDLAGMGARAKDAGPFSLERQAADVLAVVDSLNKPVVLIGQSMGAQVAELVVAARPNGVEGLILITPVPLAGTHMSPEMLAQFKSPPDPSLPPGEARRGVMVTVTQPMIDRFSRSTSLVDPLVAGQLVDAWNGGHPDGAGPSKFSGAVAILHGSGDWFINPDVVAAGVTPRFSAVSVSVVDKAGHWPHVEQPAQVAALVEAFLTSLRS